MEAQEKVTRQTYTVDEVAEILGVNRSTVYEWARSGGIEHIRIFRRVLIPREAVRRLFEKGTLQEGATDGKR